MKILLVDDDTAIRDSLRMALESLSFAVDYASDGDQGSFLARTNEYDLVILDNVLPGKQGKNVCQEMRDSGKDTPILMLSVKKEVNEKIELLNCGVDDYMTKPFSFEELHARINTLLRRPKRIVEQILKVSDIYLYRDRQQVKRKHQEIYLTRKEFSLLEILMQNKNCVVTRGQILEHVWDINADPFSNTIEAHVLNLRKKIGDSKKNIIQNIPGRGYKITAG